MKIVSHKISMVILALIAIPSLAQRPILDTDGELTQKIDALLSFASVDLSPISDSETAKEVARHISDTRENWFLSFKIPSKHFKTANLGVQIHALTQNCKFGEIKGQHPIVLKAVLEEINQIMKYGDNDPLLQFRGLACLLNIHVENQTEATTKDIHGVLDNLIRTNLNFEVQSKAYKLLEILRGTPDNLAPDLVNALMFILKNELKSALAIETHPHVSSTKENSSFTPTHQ